jgi:hypothetical protein
MKYAQLIRDFFHTLFHSTRIEELKAERDYFRGRMERIELILMQRLQPPRMVVPELHPQPHRKTLAELQAELTAKESQEAKQKEN